MTCEGNARDKCTRQVKTQEGNGKKKKKHNMILKLIQSNVKDQETKKKSNKRELNFKETLKNNHKNR